MNRMREVLLLVTSATSESADALRAGAGLLGAENVVTADTPDRAIEIVRARPDFVFFELDFPRHEGARIERAVRAVNPSVPLVAVGRSVRGSIAFRLIAAGVDAYLDAPFTPADVVQCVERFAAHFDPLARVARVGVGLRDLKQAQRVLRLSMYDEALVRTRGSRRAAAKLLGVDRRAVQKMAADLAEGAPFERRIALEQMPSRSTTGAAAGCAESAGHERPLKAS